MSREKFDQTLASIGTLDQQAMAKARQHQDSLTKPLGSLGILEELSVKIAGITGNPRPQIIQEIIFTLAGDHGVVAEGVTAYPQEVTAQMVYNFLRGGAAINVLARQVGAKVVVADMGVAADLGPHPELVIKKIAPGTANMAQGPAMTQEQAIQSIQAGIELVEERLATGLDLIATGDMGIGNTTPSSALAALFTGQPVAEVTGRGTGIDDGTFDNKVRVIERALQVNQPDASDALDALAKVGGFEIGGLAGIMLAGAAHRVPVVIDGFISGAAALIAVGLAPQAKEFLIPAHCSAEAGHRAILNHLGLRPLLDLDLRLGEGTGAALGMMLVEAACNILNEMATFSDAGVSEAL